MLRLVAAGVLIHESEFCQSNAVVVQGRAGVLLIDAGVLGHEMAAIASDLRELGQPVVAGFSTHPHWDHLLWDARFGAATRYGTARCAATARNLLSDAHWKARIAGWIPPDIAEQVPLDLLGLVAGLPAGTARIPWDGPQVRIIEHQAHAPGHAALVIEERGVLVAGDMLSDVLIPMLDLNEAADPIEDYLAALRLLTGAAGDVDVLVPGHGSVGGADQVRARIDRDRAYVHALRDARVPSDPRIGPSAAYDWVPGVHARQVQRLARRSELLVQQFEFGRQGRSQPPRRLAPDRYDFMTSALQQTGETFEYWESPIHGLGHLDLRDRRSFALVAASAAGQVPVRTATIAITDDLPALELQMVWKRDNASATLGIFIDTARGVARREGWNDPA